MKVRSSKCSKVRKKPFNGYVYNPWSIIVPVALIGLFSFLVAVFSTMIMIHHSNNKPVYSEQVMEFESIEMDRTSIILHFRDGTAEIDRSLVQDISSLEMSIEEGETFTAYVSTTGSNHTLKLWGLQDESGKVLLRPEDAIADYQTGLIQLLFASWVLFGVYCLLTAGGTYVLSNAPRYRKLAALLVRKEWRNF